MICKSKKNVLQIDSVFLDPFTLEYCYLGKLSRIMVGSLNSKKCQVYIMQEYWISSGAQLGESEPCWVPIALITKCCNNRLKTGNSLTATWKNESTASEKRSNPSELPTFSLTNHENEVEAVGKYHMLTTIVYQTPANDTKWHLDYRTVRQNLRPTS